MENLELSDTSALSSILSPTDDSDSVELQIVYGFINMLHNMKQTS